MADRDTTSYGILQGDVVVRSTLSYGLQELRQQPHLIDQALSWLEGDDLTKDVYGRQEVDQARRWFLRTRVYVALARRIGEARFPCVLVSLVSSREVRDTLSDLSPETFEPAGRLPEPLITPFAPVSYDRLTGKLVVPDAVAAALVMVPGQVLVTREGREYPLLSVPEANVCYVKPGLAVELAGSTIVGAKPTHLNRLYCARFAESYQVGVHVNGEAYQGCLWLHTLVEFVLLRHRFLMLSRGLDCQQIESTALTPDRMFEGSPEQIHTRGIALSGECTKYWVGEQVRRPDYAELVLGMSPAVRSGALRLGEEEDRLVLGGLDV